MVRVVGVSRAQSTSAARFSLGIVRLVESAVKPSRRITKARSGVWVLRALALLPHEALNSLRQQALPEMIRALRLSRPVVKGVNWAARPKLVSTQTVNGEGEGQPLAA